MVHIHVGISRDEQVHVAVAIIIAPGGAGGKAGNSAKPGLLSDIFKLAVAESAIEDAVSVASDEQVQIAVVVEIGHGNAHAPAFHGESGLLGDVGEVAVGALEITRDTHVSSAADSVNTGTGRYHAAGPDV